MLNLRNEKFFETLDGKGVPTGVLLSVRGWRCRGGLILVQLNIVMILMGKKKLLRFLKEVLLQNFGNMMEGLPGD